MAGYNELLEGRYNRFFQKLFGIKGPAAVAQLSSDIQPVVPIFTGVEMRFLESWNRYALGVAVGPVAAQVCNFRFRNPLKSGMIAVFEKIIWVPNQNDSLSWGRILAGGTTLPSTDLSVVVSGQAIDLRQLIGPGVLGPVPTSNSGLQCSRDTGSSPNNFTYGFQQVLANTTSPDIIANDEEAIVLAPGDVFQLDSGTVNGKVFLSAVWRERAIGDAEVKG